MSHFWWVGTIASSVQWVVAGACAVASIYYSIAVRGKTEEAKRWMHSVDWLGYKRFSAPRSSNDVVAQQVNSLFAAGIR